MTYTDGSNRPPQKNRKPVKCISSSTPKQGLAKYRYKNRYGVTQYIWCNYDPTEPADAVTAGRIIAMLILGSFFSVVCSRIRPLFETNVPLALLLTAVVMVVTGAVIKGIMSGRRHLPDAVMVADENGTPTGVDKPKVRLVQCAYCNGTYSADVTNACPHCNAPVTYN